MEAKASQEQARMLEIDESIATLDAAEEHAAACAALVDAAFELDREAATHLCGMHDGVLSGAPLPSPPGSPHKRASLKEQATINTAFGAPNASLTDAAFDRSPKGGSKPTRQRLLQQTYNLVRERLRLSEACVADVEARMAQHSADCEAARHARQEELLALRSERSAIEQETAEREAFVRQKRAQLKVELDEVRASVMAVHALEECLAMLEGEAQAASARRDKATLASNDADAVREEAVVSLDTTRARSKERLKAMRATVAAETDVAKTRMASTDAIMGQLARLAGPWLPVGTKRRDRPGACSQRADLAEQCGQHGAAEHPQSRGRSRERTPRGQAHVARGHRVARLRPAQQTLRSARQASGGARRDRCVRLKP